MSIKLTEPKNPPLPKGSPDSPRSARRSWTNSRGFTLVEALVAVAVLAIGLVGLQAAMRRGLVSSVKAWDRAYKTNLAISRLEEHKAQLFGEYIPGMQLPIIEPTARPGGTPGVEFQGNTLTYGADVKVFIDAENNVITTQPGYGVILSLPAGAGTPTQVASPTYYYGQVGTPTPFIPPSSSPTPSTGYAWIHPNPQDLCNPTLGNIYFDITTPPNINGTMAFGFADYKTAKRAQSVWFGTFQKQIYGAGQIPAPTAVPTVLSFPISRFDTVPTPSNGLLRFRVKQEGNPGVWGIPMENGTNQVNFTLQCGPTPPPTPTPTGTPSGICTNGNCTQIDAYDDATLSGSYDNSTSGGDHIRPEGTSGYARYIFNLTCTGVFKVQVYACTNDNSGENNSLKVTLTGSAVTPLWTDATNGVTAVWYPDPTGAVCDDYDPMEVRHIGTGSNYSNSTVVPAQWEVTTAGPVTLHFYYGNVTFYPRINWFCLTRVGDTGSVPTSTPVPAATATFTPTATTALYHMEGEAGTESGAIVEACSNTCIRANVANSGSKNFVTTVVCGTYKISAGLRANSTLRDTWGVSIVGVNDTAGRGPATCLVTDLDDNVNTQDVNALLAGPSTVTRNWQLSAGAVTVVWYGLEESGGNSARMDWFELIKVGEPPCLTSTPTRTNTPVPAGTSTFTRTATFSPTNTPSPTPTSAIVCTFPAKPTPRTQSNLSPNYLSTPGWGQFGCDNQLGIGSFLTVEGLTDTFKTVRLYSGPMTVGPTDVTGIVVANVYIPTTSAVTLRVVGVQATPGVPVTYTGGYSNTGSPSWQAVTVASLPAGVTITSMNMEFTGTGLSTTTTNRIGVDSIRVIYDTILNPNAVMTWASFSAMDFKRDVWTHRPNYIVDSYVQPMEVVGAAKGYQVKIVVHNGKYLGMVTPTPGTGVNQLTPVPYALPTGKFPPVTIINSISP